MSRAARAAVAASAWLAGGALIAALVHVADRDATGGHLQLSGGLCGLAVLCILVGGTLEWVFGEPDVDPPRVHVRKQRR